MNTPSVTRPHFPRIRKVGVRYIDQFNRDHVIEAQTGGCTGMGNPYGAEQLHLRLEMKPKDEINGKSYYTLHYTQAVALRDLLTTALQDLVS